MCVCVLHRLGLGLGEGYPGVYACPPLAGFGGGGEGVNVLTLSQSELRAGGFCVVNVVYVNVLVCTVLHIYFAPLPHRQGECSF